MYIDLFVGSWQYLLLSVSQELPTLTFFYCLWLWQHLKSSSWKQKTNKQTNKQTNKLLPHYAARLVDMNSCGCVITPFTTLSFKL